MNKAILIGTVIKKPVLHYTKNGNPLINYQIRVPKDADNERWDVINCTAFGNLAHSAVRKFEEDTKLLIIGHLQSNNYRNMNGERVYTTEVIVESQEMIDTC